MIRTLLYLVLLLTSTPALGQQAWQHANTGTTDVLGVISWPSRDTAYTWGKSGVLRSEDGGKNWHPIKTPVVGPLEMMRSGHGLLLQNEGAYYTDDKGATWKYAVDSLLGFNTFTQVNDTLAFVIDYATVARTIDGGKHWTLPGKLNAANLYGVAFRDSRVGVVVGDPVEGPLPSQLGAGCWRTTDGGSTWKQLYTGAPNMLRAVTYVGSDTIVAVYDHEIYRSTNSGDSWDSISHTDLGLDGLEAVASRGAHLISVGTSGLIMTSSDAGQTWVRQESGTSTYLYHVNMYDDSTAIATGEQGEALVTTNGGISWVSPTVVVFPDSMIVCPNPCADMVQFRFSNPIQEYVKLQIYTASGRYVTSLVDQELRPAHEVQALSVRCKGMSSGSYLYRLTMGTRVLVGIFQVER